MVRLMASTDSGGTQRVNRHQDHDEPVTQVPAEVAERKEQLDDEIDAVLDDIDEVLEENAEEFVRGFVQKGGQ